MLLKIRLSRLWKKGIYQINGLCKTVANLIMMTVSQVYAVSVNDLNYKNVLARLNSHYGINHVSTFGFTGILWQ